MSSQNGSGLVIEQSVSLAPLTSFRIGGPAMYLAVARSVDEVTHAVQFAEGERVPLKVLGGGSNILVSDAGVRAVVLKLAAEDDFGEVSGSGGIIRAGGAVKTGKLVSFAEERGLSGLEPLAGIPGTIAGAVRMNAGGEAGTVGPRVKWVRTFDLYGGGEPVELGPGDIEFGYRSSSLTGQVILEVGLELEEADEKTVGEATRERLLQRRSNQPGGKHSAGCVFKNPGGIPAGEMIDQLGLKGAAAGGAAVSRVHANFIVASKGAKASDVMELIELIRERALRERGVELELEIELWK